MTVQRVAQIFGWVFVLVAIWGFFVSGGSMDAGMDAPAILGLFPVNVLHNVAHLILGLWGIVASRNFGSAKTYAQIAGVLYLVLAVLGFVDPTGFGLLPLGGADIALHAVLGIILAGVGFTAKPGRAATA
ncbi:MAG TPA: DUF4383 domain-containing protein [Gemmatimonadota bacterium]|jgi:hypothetical protein|nr:DUF4383 domain-containing protein [Gemmatimonadota bacterium]